MHWLGAADAAAEGDWVWADGTAWTFTDWKAGQPDNANIENCLMKNWRGVQWNDVSCTTGRSGITVNNFVCKFNL